MYAGLTTADKGALLDAKAAKQEWITRDKSGRLSAYPAKPYKLLGTSQMWIYHRERNVSFIDLDENLLPFIQWSDAEPVNIDIALAQIAEMESKQKELLSEKASEKGCADKLMTNADHWIGLWKNDVLLMARMFVYEQKSESGDYEYLVSDPDGTEIALMDSYCEAIKRAAMFLNSPYTEGATK